MIKKGFKSKHWKIMGHKAGTSRPDKVVMELHRVRPITKTEALRIAREVPHAGFYVKPYSTVVDAIPTRGKQ